MVLEAQICKPVNQHSYLVYCLVVTKDQIEITRYKFILGVLGGQAQEVRKKKRKCKVLCDSYSIYQYLPFVKILRDICNPQAVISLKVDHPPLILILLSTQCVTRDVLLTCSLQKCLPNNYS